MEKRRMNLPTGPDTLCFDKDEFMKVRAPGRSPLSWPDAEARWFPEAPAGVRDVGWKVAGVSRLKTL
jgi:hypothetical protein